MKWTALAFGVAAVSAAEVTPTQKVIQLLQGMEAKGKEEKHGEQVQFAAYKQFCDDTTTDKQRAIAEANDRIEQLSAKIQKNTADAKQLAKEVSGHDADIATWEGDRAAATSVRDTEKADYDTEHADYTSAIDAVERATAMLKKQDFDRKQDGAALLEVSQWASREQTAKITAFLATDAEIMQPATPDAHGYEFQSGGVIELLDELNAKFNDEKDALMKRETNSKHAFDLLMQDLKAEVENATNQRTEKTATRGKKLQNAADAKGDKNDTTATRDDDQKYLSDLTATCEQKASDFENRQQLRADEIAAINQAVEILSGSAVSGAAAKHLPALAQETSFLQMSARATTMANHDNQLRVVTYLQTRAKDLNSRVLMQLATSAGADPFKKVKKLIQDLIVRLMEQANEEAEKKGWCDTELASNEATRKEKTSKVESLHADIDGLEASIAKLTEDVASLTEAVSQLDTAVATATSIRAAEKEKNTQTIADSKAAQQAVSQALLVLKEFYAKAGTATSLMQQQPESPAIFDGAYQGMQSENGGVVGMIEVIQSDFARLETETETSEKLAQDEHDTFLNDSAVDKAQKNKDIEHKTTKKQNEAQALQEKKSDLEGTQKELDAALAYFDKLKPECINSGGSFEDRVARREEEIQSLQEALRILNGEDIA